MSAIFWFSGTGNSLHAAKRLAAGLNEMPLHPMSLGVPPEAVGGDGEKIGFVFPSYYGNLPRAVRAFVEKLEVRPGTYLFAVVTMGALGQGSVAALRSALKQKNLRLDYGRGVHMPPNYIMRYNPADPSKSEGTLDKSARRIARIASEIAAGKKSVRAFRFTANNLYKNIDSLDAQFFAEDTCIACGQCERICPVGNIRMNESKPGWSHHCEHCVACISWCPVQAIQYGDRTKERRRYRNPKVAVDEMLVKR
jgi:ferredoxin